MKKQLYWRYGIYSTGTVIAAFALTLISIGGLGVSPIIAIPYSVATGLGTDFSLILRKMRSSEKRKTRKSI